MTDDDDYERVEDYLDDCDNEIYMRYGETYYKLNDTTKEQVLIDKFFKGLDAYSQSAMELRIGLDEYHKTGGIGTNEEVFHFQRRGKTIHAIRDTETGRIKRWLK